MFILNPGKLKIADTCFSHYQKLAIVCVSLSYADWPLRLGSVSSTYFLFAKRWIRTGRGVGPQLRESICTEATETMIMPMKSVLRFDVNFLFTIHPDKE